MKVEANGIEMGYDLAGAEGAPVVVLSHSLAASRRMWEPQLPALSEQGYATATVVGVLCGSGALVLAGYFATRRIARLALARSFTLSDFSWPQAAMMSRPRGDRTGLA